MLRIPNVRSQEINLRDLKYTPATMVSEDLVLQAHDLLFIRSNGSRDVIGRAAAAGPGVGSTFASYLIRFRLAADPALVKWVELVAASPSRRQALVENASSSAGQYNLSIPDLAGMTVPLPEHDELVAIIEEYERRQTLIAAAEHAISQQLRRCATLRRSILATAFSGSLVAQDPNDEPAIALLTRIRDERAAAGQSKTVKKNSTTTPRKPREKKEPVE